MLINILYVGFGGALGAISRFGINEIFENYLSLSSPIGTLFINVMGCFLIGLILGITLPSKMNTSNGQFNIYAETSVGGKETQKQMDGGNELTRKLLARKFQEISNEGFE